MQRATTQRPTSPGLGEMACAVGQLATSVSDAVEDFLRTLTPAARPSKHDDHCQGCGRDDCHCTCCVTDADIVVYTRLFERRVVPIRIENTRRRERQITLELSRFTTRGGKRAPVEGRIEGPTSFTLGGCEERDLTLVIDVGKKDDDVNHDEERERPSDVEDCVVAVADLRIEGCDHRPVRIAVPILPRDCASYEIACECACCG